MQYLPLMSDSTSSNRSVLPMKKPEGTSERELGEIRSEFESLIGLIPMDSK